MGIMAGSAVFDDPPAGPVGDAFAVSAARPVFFLPEVALAAHLVAVIHIDLRSLFGYQIIALIFFVASITGQGLILSAMDQNDIAMGHFCGPSNRDGFVIMTLTALEALHLVFTGFRPERLRPVFRLYGYFFFGNQKDGIESFFIIEGVGCILNGPVDTALPGRIHRPCRKDDEHCGR